MDTASVTYLGELRNAAVHVRSGDRIITDAPVDNQGQGAAFSPTDLLSVALCTCILTTMGIQARARGIAFERAGARVVKHMAADPRRVARVEVHIELDARLTSGERAFLEGIAHTCPVALSLHPDLVQATTFSYR